MSHVLDIYAGGNVFLSFPLLEVTLIEIYSAQMYLDYPDLSIRLNHVLNDVAKLERRKRSMNQK